MNIHGERRYGSTIHDLATKWLWGQLHAPATLSSREWASSTLWTGGWVDLRGSLDIVEKKNNEHQPSNL
jgi:hypothetical protein